MMVVLFAYLLTEITSTEPIYWIKTFLYMKLLHSCAILLCVTNSKYTQVISNRGHLDAALEKQGASFPSSRKLLISLLSFFGSLPPDPIPGQSFPCLVSHTVKNFPASTTLFFPRNIKSYVTWLFKHWTFSNLLGLL